LPRASLEGGGLEEETACRSKCRSNSNHAWSNFHLLEYFGATPTKARVVVDSKTYLTGLDTEAASAVDQQRTEEILTFTINLEHAGDVIDKNCSAMRQSD
jgi:hypothetical protein